VGVGECKKELSVFGAGWCGLDVERERRRRNSGCSQRAVVCRARAGRLHHPATHGMRVSPAVRADEVCPVCEQGAAEDGRMVRCRSCRNPYHQVCVMHNPYLMHEEDFECGSENCPSPPAPLPMSCLDLLAACARAICGRFHSRGSALLGSSRRRRADATNGARRQAARTGGLAGLRATRLRTSPTRHWAST
jgi:hypothetical protein